MSGEADVLAVRNIRITHQIVAVAPAYENDEVGAAVGVDPTTTGLPAASVASMAAVLRVTVMPSTLMVTKRYAG